MRISILKEFKAICQLNIQINHILNLILSMEGIYSIRTWSLVSRNFHRSTIVKKARIWRLENNTEGQEQCLIYFVHGL